MSLVSKNPATDEVLKEYEEITDAELEAKVAGAAKAAPAWAALPIEERAVYMSRLAILFKEEKERVGKLVALEIGRPLAASIAESEKCAWACEYFAEHAGHMLAPKSLPMGAGEGEIRFDPLGVILAIMPWNFPFWQVARFLAPTLMAGNVALLKHASNVPQSAVFIEELVKRAGFPEGVFQNLLIGSKRVGGLIDDDRIAAVTLTGSVGAGVSVAERAGKNLKKVVLELGGSDPFIVLKDAEIGKAAKVAAEARLNNAGQSCICAKRFIVEEAVLSEFLSAFKAEMEKQVLGDPFDPKTTVGPVSSQGAREELEKQVTRSVELGAKVVTGGARVGEKGSFYKPTILTDVKKGMPAYEEEFFGPVASVISVKDEDEAIKVANDTEFGLGASLWTRDTARARDVLAPKINAGMVFINQMVKSDPRLPFGGIKKSGYGRELGAYGIKEFVNVKTVSLAP